MRVSNEKRFYHRYEMPRAFLRCKKKGLWDIIRPRREGDLKNFSRDDLPFARGENLTAMPPINSSPCLTHGACRPLKGELDRKDGHTTRKLAALHLSAHVVLARFLGFTPLSAGLNSEGKEDYEIDYGKYSPVATPLMTKEISPELFSVDRDMPRKTIFDLAKRLCCILAAGDITENFARFHYTCGDTEETGLSGPDLYRALAISDHFFVDLVKEIVFLYECLKDERLWNPINRMAEDILENRENRLSGAAIVKSLKDSGSYAFLTG